MISLSADLFMIELTGCRYRRTFTTDAIVILHRRTFYRAVRTKDTAVARLRAQQGLAVRTFVEKLARVGRHRFSFREAANGTHPTGHILHIENDGLYVSCKEGGRKHDDGTG